MADSAGPGERGADYASRPEIAGALGGKTVQETRNSQTLGTQILATAVPVRHGPRIDGAVRVTQSVEAVHRATRRAILSLALLGGVVLALGVAAAAVIARATSRPIRRLEEAARRVEEGDLAAAAVVEGSSEQRSLARSFNRMTSRISRMLRGQQEFVADASHQLRTPLTGIRLELEELREGLPEGDERIGGIDTGIREVDRLSGIVDELLILSRAGERGSPFEEFDVAGATERIADRLGKTAAEAGIRLTVTRRGDAGTSVCPRADFERALEALIENAIRYSPDGSEIEIGVESERVEVLDRGPGLEPGEEETVFERFHRGSAGTGTKGTGLGLSIARELAAEWGGSVTLHNRDGGGVRAVLDLPRAPVEAGPEVSR
ncbi:MAG TPA: HAMP domain-containing sensor histidine kinase [Solirubrobacterales bacterium]|nr:HAMP domain-containing sensor histidine kinase [Solirubrobacterales bacterium]